MSVLVEKLLLRNPLVVSLSRRFRASKMRLFREFAGTARTILDVGSGAEYANIGATNSILAEFQDERSVRIVGLGLDDLSEVKKKYVHAFLVYASGREIPFGDNTFDVAHSNAVVEHVIGEAERKAFIAEMVRVARKVWVTTPDRRFPIEVHSRLPVVHWLPQRLHNFVLGCLGLERFARGTYFDPLSESDLRGLFPSGTRVRIIRAGMGTSLIACAEKS